MRSLISSLAFATAASVLSVHAGAQTTESSASPAVASSTEPSALAQQNYRHGIELYELHQYEEALAAFRTAQGYYPSPNIRLYIARCLRGLGRPAEATVEYDLTTREAADRARQDARYAPTRTAADAEMTALAPQIGRVRVVAPSLPSWSWVRVAGREVPAGNLGIAVPVTPGRVVIEIEAHGYRPLLREVNVSAGANQDVSISLERESSWDGQPPTATELAAEVARRAERDRAPLQAPAVVPEQHSSAPIVTPASAPPPPPPWMRPLAWGVLGVGAVGLVSVAAFGGASLVIYNGVNERCAAMQCPAAEQSNIDTGRTFQTIANVSLVVGVVGALGGATLWWLSRDPHPRATVGFSGDGVVVRGAF